MSGYLFHALNNNSHQPDKPKATRNLPRVNKRTWSKNIWQCYAMSFVFISCIYLFIYLSALILSLPQLFWMTKWTREDREVKNWCVSKHSCEMWEQEQLAVRQQVHDFTSSEKNESSPQKQDLSFWQVKWHHRNMHSFQSLKIFQDVKKKMI